MSAISEWLEEKRQAGTLDSSGQFTVDVKKALEKLGRFLLQGPEEALLKIVQFGVSRQTMAVTVESTPHGYSIHFLGLLEKHPADKMLEDIVEVISERTGDPRFDLMIGLNYFLQHDAEALIARWHTGALVDAAGTGGVGNSALEGHPDPRFPDTLSVELRFARAKPHFEVTALRRHLAFCPTLVSLDNIKLNLDDRFAKDTGFKHHSELTYQLDGKNHPFEVTALIQSLSAVRAGKFEADIVPVRWAVTLEPFKVAAPVPGIRLIVQADDVATALGGLALQDGPAWQARQPQLQQLLVAIAQKVPRIDESQPTLVQSIGAAFDRLRLVVIGVMLICVLGAAIRTGVMSYMPAVKLNEPLASVVDSYGQPSSKLSLQTFKNVFGHAYMPGFVFRDTSTQEGFEPLELPPWNGKVAVFFHHSRTLIVYLDSQERVARAFLGDPPVHQRYGRRR